ncbi:hypothetical protein MJO28_005382 [Puccinia striiformis f. sp. tritici]|uniref:Uncharacterized protein n=1 Tax=Puccinia striiformis f. sp. tritici TaxID=168172 RepID=A0ACC0EM98_9BASI|nr:hypothetical protein Pst134EA_009535 [Puccinia striiformis f. sp. tritici]XP_047808471.1 hypothetical protein Pst134EA_009538 [Puccinia striiformis f. sp. tritici]KAH9458318.1 hypothetical protein Pst134EB_010624 [Puccinia striiformis f. sp. tritici]KAH9469014.1 hypothetical protein Pst134EA_009535 [Puccinia striiformis f. sp. tritici]KAH9469017.1 hypothetical protein Pst134EA_009538 [Puccinia striiformis f. sp. tritici]KAI7954982.1 hypothetical protein MJO28_005382 [Puccinia striiformis f.
MDHRPSSDFINNKLRFNWESLDQGYGGKAEERNQGWQPMHWETNLSEIESNRLFTTTTWASLLKVEG